MLRGEGAPHHTSKGAEEHFCASISSEAPFPTPPSHSAAHQSQPFLGVSSVRNDSVFLQQRLLAACQAPGSCLFPFLLPSELWSFC